jgi:(p)ppGpp synthase/HD superfamily hydrolase
MSETILTQRFEKALVYASQLHKGQVRKGTNIPYLSHLLAVTAIVLEDGGDEDMAIAALLHDAVEDQGGEPTLLEIKRRFGDRVAFIVDGCTDSYEQPKPPWLERKKEYLEHLRSAPQDVRRVSLADKLHNTRSILFNLRVSGESAWERFSGGKEGSLWYYKSLAKIFRETEDSPMVSEYVRVVEKIEQLAASGSEPPVGP